MVHVNNVQHVILRVLNVIVEYAVAQVNMFYKIINVAKLVILPVNNVIVEFVNATLDII